MREGEERRPAKKTNSGMGDCACMKTKGEEREGAGRKGGREGREGGREREKEPKDHSSGGCYPNHGVR